MELLSAVVLFLAPIVIGLLFAVIAARLITRVVLDEIRKDRAKRGPLP